MLERDLTITNKNGMHARPAAQFVKLASQFKSEILVEKDDEQVNGKSIMGLMMLAAAKGEKIRVSTQGEDEEQAMAAIEQLVRTGFGDVE
jgi:phosphocarrier protein HPr